MLSSVVFQEREREMEEKLKGDWEEDGMDVVVSWNYSLCLIRNLSECLW